MTYPQHSNEFDNPPHTHGCLLFLGKPEDLQIYLDSLIQSPKPRDGEEYALMPSETGRKRPLIICALFSF